MAGAGNSAPGPTHKHVAPRQRAGASVRSASGKVTDSHMMYSFIASSCDLPFSLFHASHLPSTMLNGMGVR
jgi:hypothetical protein